MPVGSAITNGVVAAVICILGVIMTTIAPESELFWTFFALNMVLFLMSYLPIFPAFLKLRKVDPDTDRPFKVPGSTPILKAMAFVPMALIVISITFTAVPLSFAPESLAEILPITIGAVISIALGEFLTSARQKKQKK